MPKYSQSSTDKLKTCDIRLQAVMNEVIRHVDCTIVEGHRNQEAQDKAFAEGKSQIKWPDGEHNKVPSKAVDVVPYPIDWNNRERLSYFGGFVVAVGRMMGFKIRWGGDWNMNHDVRDNKFSDLPHFEIED